MLGFGLRRHVSFASFCLSFHKNQTWFLFSSQEGFVDLAYLALPTAWHPPIGVRGPGSSLFGRLKTELPQGFSNGQPGPEPLIACMTVIGPVPLFETNGRMQGENGGGGRPLAGLPK